MFSSAVPCRVAATVRDLVRNMGLYLSSADTMQAPNRSNAVINMFPTFFVQDEK